MESLGIIGTIVGFIAEAIMGIRTVTRQAIAASLEELADKVRRGELIPDEALALASKDQTKIEEAKAKLKK